MKNPVALFRTWFIQRSMRTKLSFSFSVTMVGVLILIMILLNFFITRSYRETLLSSGEKSCEQAYSFLENYVNTMQYVSDLVYYNGELQSAMASSEFHGSRPYGVQYREFLRLDQVFATAEMVETVFRARVYVPDDVAYAQNQKHFAPYSQLYNRFDYEAFLKATQTQQMYFSSPTIEEVTGSTQPVSLLSMFRAIRRTDGTALPIGVEEVSIRTSQLQQVLEKSDITATGVVYLVNSQGKLISASGGEVLLSQLVSAGELPLGQGKGWEQRELAGKEYVVNRKWLRQADWTLVALVPEQEIASQSAFVGTVICLLSLVAVAAVFFVSLRVSRYYTRRLNRLDTMMMAVRKGELDVDIQSDEPDEIGRLLQSFSYMTRELKTLMEERYRSGKEVKSAQFKALQAQINPHFLYNTLDLMNWEAMDHGVPEIAEIAQSLAKFYRISLNRGRQVVTIGEELSHVSAYVLIENRHFEGAIALKLEVPEEIKALGTINLLLQPFVENAIMHGIAENPAIQECTVLIQGRWEEDDVLLSITDDGMGMDDRQLEQLFLSDPASSHGYGVKNVNSRIKLCFGEAYGLSYSSKPGLGTTVEIRLPALTPEEAEEYVR